MAKRKYERVHLVLAKIYLDGMYVDSAWTTKEGAEQRITDLLASSKAFQVTKSRMELSVLEIRLDVMGVPIVLTVLPPDTPEAKPQ